MNPPLKATATTLAIVAGIIALIGAIYLGGTALAKGLRTERREDPVLRVLRDHNGCLSYRALGREVPERLRVRCEEVARIYNARRQRELEEAVRRMEEGRR